MKHIEIQGLDELPKAARLILETYRESLVSGPARPVILFRGSMGAGKTTLISAICEELGVVDTVTSPTFALVNEYQSADGSPVFHFDFYRIEKEEEAFDFGCEEYFYSGNLCLVEWPEKIENLIPENPITVRIEATGNDERVITVE